jgi:hypothetical protein
VYEIETISYYIQRSETYSVETASNNLKIFHHLFLTFLHIVRDRKKERQLEIVEILPVVLCGCENWSVASNTVF